MRANSGILDSFKDELNPKLWASPTSLRSEFRDQALSAIQGWAEKNELEVLAVLLYGGNAGYQYSDSSDADISVYVDLSPISPEKYEVLKDELYEKGFTFEGIETHLFLKPPTEVEHVEANENVYNILDQKWISEPIAYSFDPKEEFSDLLVYAEEFKGQMQRIFASVLKELEEYTEMGVESLPPEALSNLRLLLSTVKTLRSNRNVEHKKLREKAVRGEKITLHDRVSQNEILWKSLSDTKMVKSLDRIKTLL